MKAEKKGGRAAVCESASGVRSVGVDSVDCVVCGVNYV